jgi:hypothetical protein
LSACERRRKKQAKQDDLEPHERRV